MKKLAILFVLFLSSVVAFAQEAPLVTEATMPKFTNPSDYPIPMVPEPYKKVNVIYILTKDSAATAYSNIGKAFIAAGFNLASTNKEFLTITTDTKGEKNTALYTLSASIQDQKGWRIITLRGQFTAAVAEALMRGGSQIKSDIRFMGAKGSMYMVGWERMLNIAKSYPGGQLGYWTL